MKGELNGSNAIFLTFLRFPLYVLRFTSRVLRFPFYVLRLTFYVLRPTSLYSVFQNFFLVKIFKLAVIKNGGGSIKLEFTSDIKDDQLPLRGYTIQWNDGSPDAVVQGSFQERPSPADPHSVYHYYSYDEADCSVANCEISTCEVDGVEKNCKIFYVNIDVEDNWGRHGLATSSPIYVAQ